jgi:holliday junction DNA helicase RuvA
MISYITGKLVEKNPTFVVIDKNGIGIQIYIPLSTFESLPDPAFEIRLETFLYVREDALILYGFRNAEERELFLHLLSVSGIGPKLALTILSGIKINDFYQYVSKGDEVSLTRVKGLGKKTAQRLILDLKEFAAQKAVQTDFSRLTPRDHDKEIYEEALLALLSLGYTRAEAEKSIGKAISTSSAFTGVEELVRIALNN